MIESKFLQIIRDAEAHPYNYGLFSFLRLIESVYSALPPLGSSFEVKDEPLAVLQNASLCFPASELSSVACDSSGKIKLESHVFGLLGVNGPLPFFYTEHIHQQKHDLQDDSFLGFLNIFNHRLNLLFYRAWASADPCISLGRTDDSYSRFLSSLIHSRVSLSHDDESYRSSMIGNAGWFARQVRNTEGLEFILSDFFSLTVKVKEFVADWIKLDESQQSRVSGINSVLGESAFLGSSALGLQHKFRMFIGPMPLEQYKSFFPEGSNSAVLSKWVSEYIGLELDWDACLILEKNDVFNVCLTGNSQLGRTSWLQKTPVRDRDDLVINYISWSA